MDTTRRLLSTVRGRWLTFWFPVGPPHALALFRIGFGTIMVLRWLELAFHVPLLLSKTGIYRPAIHLPFGGPPIWVAYVLYVFALTSAVALTVGLWTRCVLWLHFLLFGYHYVLYFHATSFSFDPLSLLLNLCLLFSPCGRALSIDARRARPESTDCCCDLWTQRLLCAQVVLFYFGSGAFKVSSPIWHDGALLYFTLHDMWATQLSFWLTRRELPGAFYDLAVIVVVIFELYMALLLVNRRWLRVASVLGTVFHVSIVLLMGIWQFLVLPPSYVLFADPEMVRSWLWAKRRWLLHRQASLLKP